MVAPLLQLALAGTGLLAGRSLQGRRRRRAVGLIDTLMNAEVGADGVGPPVPIGGARELAVLDYLRQTDPTAGAEFAIGLAGRRDAQAQQELTMQQRMGAALDPVQASNLALREGREQYQVYDQALNQLVNVDAQGSKAYNDNVTRLQGVTGLLQTVSRMQELVRIVEPGAAALDSDDPLARELAGLAQGLVGDIRALEQTGALDEGSLQYFRDLLPGGTEITDLFATPESLVSALQAGSERFARRLGELEQQTRFYTGLDPALTDRIAGIKAARARNAQEIASYTRPPSLAAAIRPSTQELRELGVGMVNEANERMRQFNEGGSLFDLVFGGRDQQQSTPVPGGAPLDTESFLRMLLEGIQAQNTGGRQ